MDGRNFSPFYRTLSPVRAAAQPPPMKIKEKVEQGKGTADHWATYFSVIITFIIIIIIYHH